MPAGLVNNLSSRQQFLDLVRYLMEIAEKGPARARELKPDPSLLSRSRLCPSRSATSITPASSPASDQQSFQRGEAIYNRVCGNCHGTKDRPAPCRPHSGLPRAHSRTAPTRSRMYRTLTLGFGQMTPQTWMVPRQKYDVIHYIREAYLKPYQSRPVCTHRPDIPGADCPGERAAAPSRSKSSPGSRWTTVRA